MGPRLDRFLWFPEKVLKNFRNKNYLLLLQFQVQMEEWFLITPICPNLFHQKRNAFLCHLLLRSNFPIFWSNPFPTNGLPNFSLFYQSPLEINNPLSLSSHTFPSDYLLKMEYDNKQVRKETHRNSTSLLLNYDLFESELLELYNQVSRK